MQLKLILDVEYVEDHIQYYKNLESAVSVLEN